MNQVFYKEIPYHEPASLFLVLKHRKGVIWLDTACVKSKEHRYSYLMCDPLYFLKAKGKNIFLNDKKIESQHFFEYLKEELSQWEFKKNDALPPLQGGMVGYLGYELYQHIENIPLAVQDPFNCEDAYLGFYDGLVVYDHLLEKCFVVCYGYPEKDFKKRKKIAQKKMDFYSSCFEKKNQINIQKNIKQNIAPFKDRISKKHYLKQIKYIKNHILDGDVYQLNYAHSFQSFGDKNLSLPDLYLNLREIAAEPFGGYLDFGDITLLSTSPERFVKLENNIVLACPIKGSMPRYQDPKKDNLSKTQLAMSQKDRAENIMIVDLMRNDLSKVCLPSTISIPKLCEIESYSLMHHCVSHVQGYLQSGLAAVDILYATFPGGSITGVPKIKAIKLIGHYEKIQRGPYCGAFGYISFTGDMDLAITIRTLMAKPGIEKTSLHFFVGGAITADSDPEKEYQETLAKAEGFFRML